MLQYDENTMRPFATIKETAKLTGFSQSFLRRSAKAKTIPFVRIGNGKTGAYMINVRAFIDQMNQESIIAYDEAREEDRNESAANS